MNLLSRIAFLRFLSLLAPALWVSAPVGAVPPPGTGPDPKGPVLRVGVVAVGAVDEALVTRLREHLAQHLRLEAPAHAALPAEARPLHELAAAHAALRAEGEALLLLLVAGAATNQPHGFLDPQRQVGVVHVDAQRHEDAEIHARRLEKQCVRGVAFLLGMTTCPNPRCALFPYRNHLELDAIGRNVCPPCTMAYGNQVGEAGRSLRPLVMPDALRRKIEERRRAQEGQAPGGGPAAPP